MTELKLNVSRIWKDRLLDLIRILSIILAFWTIWLERSGDRMIYNIEDIITIFMALNIFFTILLGEYNRVQDYKLENFEDELERIKNKKY